MQTTLIAAAAGLLLFVFCGMGIEGAEHRLEHRPVDDSPETQARDLRALRVYTRLWVFSLGLMTGGIVLTLLEWVTRRSVL